MCVVYTLCQAFWLLIRIQFRLVQWLFFYYLHFIVSCSHLAMRGLFKHSKKQNIRNTSYTKWWTEEIAFELSYFVWWLVRRRWCRRLYWLHSVGKNLTRRFWYLKILSMINGQDHVNSAWNRTRKQKVSNLWKMFCIDFTCSWSEFDEIYGNFVYNRAQMQVKGYTHMFYEAFHAEKACVSRICFEFTDEVTSFLAR